MDLLSALESGGGTLLSQLGGGSTPTATSTSATPAPSGNASTPSIVKSFPSWGYFAIGGAILLLIVLLRR